MTTQPKPVKAKDKPAPAYAVAMTENQISLLHQAECWKQERLGVMAERNRLTAEVARLREFVDAWDSRLASPSVLSAQRLAKARAALEEEK